MAIKILRTSTNRLLSTLGGVISYQIKYGYLYNGAAVRRTDLPPTGWHIPNDTEWEALFTYLGGMTVAWNKLRETGTVHWKPQMKLGLMVGVADID
jgi:uncharacterized protein (TIGR02145 family)